MGLFLIGLKLKFLPHDLSDLASFFVLALLHLQFEVVDFFDKIVSLLPDGLLVPLFDLNLLCLECCFQLQHFLFCLFAGFILDLHLSDFFVEDL